MIKKQKITFCSPAKTTSSAPCKSHMTKSHDTHVQHWLKGILGEDEGGGEHMENTKHRKIKLHKRGTENVRVLTPNKYKHGDKQKRT